VGGLSDLEVAVAAAVFAAQGFKIATVAVGEDGACGEDVGVLVVVGVVAGAEADLLEAVLFVEGEAGSLVTRHSM
jgi:hypothetical protein